MLAKTGLLLLSNPKQIGLVLSSVQQKVSNILYIQLLNSKSIDNSGNVNTNFLNSLPKYSQAINGIYTQAARHCKNLDVRVLLSGIKYDLTKIKTTNPIDVIIFDKNDENKIENILSNKINTLTKNYKIITLNQVNELNDEEITLNETTKDDGKLFKHGVLGGTFDRLHIAHKLLLTEVALRSESKITIGVTDNDMIKSKVLHELIQDLSVRIENVKNFMSDICPEVTCDIVPISDSFGPSIIDPTMDMLVVSQETLRGGNKVNELRENKNLSKLHIHSVELIDEPERDPAEEKKISSSTLRMRLLGTVIKPIQINNNIQKRPYVIGLTGGIASGKSGVSIWMKELGALIIDADKIAHGIYKRGKPCYDLLIEKFGERIIGQDKEIDRTKLGAIVFKDRNELEKLNNTVWPEMLKDILDIIKNASEDVIVIDAAILLQAEWNNYCHEIWTTLISRDEAIKRLVERNHLTEEQAMLRIQAQPTNDKYVESANVVFCTLWHKEYTKRQVHRAWNLLMERINEDKMEQCKS